MEKDTIRKAAQELSNLNVWASIMVILEGGLLSGDYDHRVVDKVIEIAKKEQHKHVRKYDRIIKISQKESK